MEECKHHNGDSEELHRIDDVISTKDDALAMIEWGDNLTGIENNNPCSQQCYICFEPFVVGDLVSWTNDDHNPCQHVFHSNCIMTWLENHSNCPCCRENIIHDSARTSWFGRLACMFDWSERGKDEKLKSKSKAHYCIIHGLVFSTDNGSDEFRQL